MLGFAARGLIQAPRSAPLLNIGPYVRSISKSAIVLAHPEDRLKAARRKARAALGLPPEEDDDDGGLGDYNATTVMSQPAPPQRRQAAHESIVGTNIGRAQHPEDRLKAARLKAMQSLGIPVNNNGEVKDGAMKNVSSPAAGAGDKRMPICAQNNHPDYRLRIAREKMLAQVKEQVEDSSSSNNLQSLLGRAAARSDALVMSPDLRLSKARAEQASKPLQTFTPIKARRKRPKVLLSKLSPEQPPLRRNDGYSSGAVVSSRLRQERKSALERLLISASPSS
mmetsp:Transcript_14619/g.29541  ORF Transcript_14619/g.29541 Transcript_14619/m.29541 type:complete len:281 (-) Transcript_14619:348-1190(-)